MSARTPIAGYPSKTAAVMDMIDNKKMRPPEIARELSISPANVRNLYYSATRKRTSGFSKINVDLDVMRDAEPHARARGISPHDLCRRILAAAMADNIVDAILDDKKPETRQ